MDDAHQEVLGKIAQFGPLEYSELEQLVSTVKQYEVLHIVDELSEQGFINQDGYREDATISINTDPFNIPADDQQRLDSNTPDTQEIIKESLPNTIETNPNLSLTLSESQTRLFEKMRTDVNRTCGSKMTPEEFMDWILREARRFTEV